MPPQNQAASGSKSAPTVQSVIADPKFRALDRTSQTQVLAQIDPRFARLSEDDRGTVVERLLAQTGAAQPAKAAPNRLNPPPFSMPADTRISPPAPRDPFQMAHDVAAASLNSKFPYIHPVDALSTAAEDLGSATSPIENYTPAGRAEHPILSRVGDVTRNAKELIHTVAPEVMTIGLPEAGGEEAEALAAGRATGQVRRGVREITTGLRDPSTDILREADERAMTNAVPYLQRGKSADLPSGAGSLTAARHYLDAESTRIWQTYAQPYLERFKDSTADTSSIATDIRESVGDRSPQALTSRATRMKVRAADDLAKTYEGKSMTVAEMQKRVAELNKDRAVEKFFTLDDNARQTALQNDISLEAKVAELRSLRTKMFDVIERDGGAEAGADFRRARLAWGGVQHLEDRIARTAPTPEYAMSLWNRLKRGISTFVHPRGASAYVHPNAMAMGPIPERTIPRGLNRISRAPGTVAPPRLPPPPR